MSEKVTLVSDILSGKAESGLVRVLYKGEKQIGTTTFCRIENGGRKYFLIDEVKVTRGYKREGFLNQMLAEISFIAKKSKINRLELDVNSKNSDAISAYVRIGFKKQGEHVDETEPKKILYRFVKILD